MKIPVLLGTLILVLIISIGMIILPRYLSKKKKQICTLKIQAKIIDVKTSSSSGSNGVSTFAPCYEYTYNDVSYVKQSNLYSNRNSFPETGCYATLLINPDCPNDFYEIEREQLLFKALTILGVIFTVLSLGAIIPLTIYFFNH